MNVIVSLDDDLVQRVRKIAAARDTTLTAMIRQYLEGVATEDSPVRRQRREREALEHSFQKFQFRIGKRNWTREDSHGRS